MAYRDVSVWLEDILTSLERIKKHTEGISSYSEFANNQLVIDATERNLEVIAEALKNALKLNPELEITDSKKLSVLETSSIMSIMKFNMTGYGLL